MKRNRRFTAQLRKITLSCFTALLLLLGLAVGKDIPQTEEPEAGTPATLAIQPEPAKPNPTGLDDGGN